MFVLLKKCLDTSNVRETMQEEFFAFIILITMFFFIVYICLDCFWLFDHLLNYTLNGGEIPASFKTVPGSTIDETEDQTPHRVKGEISIIISCRFSVLLKSYFFLCLELPKNSRIIAQYIPLDYYGMISGPLIMRCIQMPIVKKIKRDTLISAN